jgi:YggT family protein
MANLLVTLLQLYNFLVIARVLISYFPNIDPNHPAVRFLYEVTEPVLRPIREFLRQQFPGMGPVDFSPIVLLILILILSRLIVAFVPF